MLKDSQTPERMPRVDPYGVLELIEPMTSAEIGYFAFPFVLASIEGRAGIKIRCVLSMCGWALEQREVTGIRQ